MAVVLVKLLIIFYFPCPACASLPSFSPARFSASRMRSSISSIFSFISSSDGKPREFNSSSDRTFPVPFGRGFGELLHVLNEWGSGSHTKYVILASIKWLASDSDTSPLYRDKYKYIREYFGRHGYTSEQWGVGFYRSWGIKQSCGSRHHQLIL